ncbi:MAG: alpha-L-fucosidase, partial [Armatimonadota bacterium]|nr:alpha-L-fucosidase [Armatimonadota bacterium]
LNEMMLQSAGIWKTEAMPTPVLRVFPAMPAVWRDAAFQDLRAQGAFLVSAVRTGGQTQWVRIESLAGEKAFLRPGIPNPTIKGDGLKQVKKGLYEVNLKRGQSVELFAAGLKTAPAIQPIAHTDANPFGLKLTP